MTPDDVVKHCTWRELLDVVPRCDLLCVDAPYSEKTHRGHDGGSILSDEHIERPDVRDNHIRMGMGLSPVRRALNYHPWCNQDVSAFVAAWASRTVGWFVSITDSVLAPSWAAALELAGRYVFAPIACVEPGSRVRMSGDGPSNWTTWAVVARPKTSEFTKWGALPGAYVIANGNGSGKRRDVVGGKPLWLMERLVEDYSRPGDLVCDPCAGAGTTLTAAIRLGRRAIGGDALEAHAALAREAVAAELAGTTVQAMRAGQTALFGDTGT